MIKKIIPILLVLFVSVESFSQDTCGLSLEKDELKEYRYILVPGVLNEMITYYLTEYRRYLMSNGVPSDQIHRINLSSYEKPAVGVNRLGATLKNLPRDKEFIFIAHSKGALETLYFLKKHHRRLNLKKAVFIQGALDGASMTKLPSGAAFPALMKYFITNLESFKYIKDYNRTFSPDRVRENLADLYEHPELIKKSLFIESEYDYEGLKWKFKFLGGLYKRNLGNAGDGVLMRSDHIPLILKNDKSVCRWRYNEDHSDLVKAAPWNRLKVKKIRNFLGRLLLRPERDQ